MVAAPQYGTVVLQGLSGRIYTLNVYLSDVANAMVNWDSGGGAGSSTDTSYIVPEPSTLVDFTIKTGMTDTARLEFIVNAVGTGRIVQFADFLNTNALRPAILLPLPQGSKLAAKQLA